MAGTVKPIQAQPFTLVGAGALQGDTTLVLASFKGIDGANLVTGDLGTKAYGTIEPGNGAQEEQISFTGVTQNTNGTATLTGVHSVEFISPYTETSGLSTTHPGATTFVLTNTSGYYSQFLTYNNDADITAVFTFTDPDYPRINSPLSNPTLPEMFTTKHYVDNVVLNGAPAASTSVQGNVQMATQSEVDTKTVVGSTGANLVPLMSSMRTTLLSDYVVDTGAADAYVITPVPAISGYITGQIFTWKSTHTNTLTSTLNVNGKGATTIYKGDGTVVLAPGDITSGQMVMVEYDGTNFQLLSNVNVIPSGSMQMYAGASAPTGWLLCDGTSYLRTTYPTLFTSISTTFGAVDGTHFSVPDMRGRAPMGVGSGTGIVTGGSALTARALSAWTGEETHTLTTPEMPAHTHTFVGGGGGATDVTGVGNSATGITYTTASTGGGGAHQNMEPTLAVNFIIKI